MQLCEGPLTNLYEKQTEGGLSYLPLELVHISCYDQQKMDCKEQNQNSRPQKK